MIKKLKKIDEHRLHYYVDVYGYGGKLITKEKHIGVPPHIEGIKEGCTSLFGDLSNISGNASKLTGIVDPELKGIIREKVFGDVSNIKGDIRDISEINFSNISGDVSHLHGSFCNIYGEVSEHLEIWQDSKWQTLYICGDVSNIYGRSHGCSNDVWGKRSFDSYMHGDVTNIKGNITELYGDVSNISGDVSNISGDVTNIKGDVSKLSGQIRGALKGNVSRIYGDCTNVDGDCSNISGDVTNLKGDVSLISGNVTGVYGETINVVGNIDECGITDDMREKGFNIQELIEDTVKINVDKVEKNNKKIRIEKIRHNECDIRSEKTKEEILKELIKKEQEIAIQKEKLKQEIKKEFAELGKNNPILNLDID